MDGTFIFTLIVLGILFAPAILWAYLDYVKTQERKGKIRTLASGTVSVTPEQFFQLRKSKDFGQSRTTINRELNFPGIYILHNVSKQMHYIGQATKVGDRVNSHMTGRGNGDVYADYKYGDQFTIKLIPLNGSGFTNLDALERSAIMTYDSYSRGYNKTRGNR